jgi:glutamate-1-semialdehyde 2,1-aminomutase
MATLESWPFESSSSAPAAPSSFTGSEQWLERARQSLAGGDSSTMRVLPYHLPLVARRGEGSRIWDVDGNEYIDLNMGYGPLIFGHRPARVLDAVFRQLHDSGSHLGFPAEINVRVAEKLKRLFPNMELLRFANSGTEAIASSVRLARTVTGRRRIVIFEGHYHGWSEAVFHRYHAPLETLPEEGFGPAQPGTLGMGGSIDDAIVVRWNDLDALRRCLERYRGEVAACLMEPVMGNAGVIAPEPGYLEGARDAAHQAGALLVFDEVITGLRLAPGGAQELLGVRADITVVSKALGGGFPVAAFGASREVMSVIVNRSLFHGGVYSGNATVMAASEAVLDAVLADGDAIYGALRERSDELAAGLGEVCARAGRPHVIQYVGPMVSLFLTLEPVERLTEYRQVRRCCDFDGYIAFQNALQRAGVYFHPNQFEPMFLSTAHTSEDIAIVLERMESALRSLGSR